MSGIAGMIDWHGGPAGLAVQAALDALAPHGRDGESLWDGGSVALGFRQTILHAEDYADKQPLAGSAGAFRLVLDGRIDNRQDLARTLALPSESCQWPDSAYVLAAFEKWGEDCVERLIGAFSFALWNARTRRLFLARDHAGQRPLYLHRGGSFVMFASCPSALFTNLRVPRDIDDERFLLDLAMVPLQPGETIYRNIERVPIGHALRIGADASITLRHWRPASIPPLHYQRDEDYVEEFRSVLSAAVACRLRSIHPIGSHLSSGWDSSTVTATAASLMQGRGPLTAYTAVPPSTWTRRAGTKSLKDEGLADEGPIAAAVARKFPNIQHTLIRGTGLLDFAALDRRADAFEYPQKTVSNVGWMESLYCDARNRGIRVMLSGGMGNRTISHDGLALLPFLLRHGRLAVLAREWMALRRQTYTLKHLSALTFGPYLPESGWELIRWAMGMPKPMAQMRSCIHPLALSERRLCEAVRRARLTPANAHRADDRMMRWYCTQTPDVSLVWSGTLAAFDVETRDPLGDRRLMAFRAAIPESQFLFRGQTKWLVRRAMEGTLPAELVAQTHRSRGRQAAEWFDAATRSRDELRAEVERCAANPRIESLIDIPVLRSLLDAWPVRLQHVGQASSYRRLLIAIGAARFMRRFLERTPSNG
jgi:asparagine synthase (glutamine-hydrolysing)